MVVEAIDAAELEFEWCLKVLAPLGGYAANADFKEAVPKFQLRLLDAITAIQHVYRRVRQEEKRLISRKPDLNQGWFRQRMVKLAFYTKALVHVLAPGVTTARDRICGVWRIWATAAGGMPMRNAGGLPAAGGSRSRAASRYLPDRHPITKCPAPDDAQ